MATPKKAKSSSPAPPAALDYSHEDEAATRKRIDAQLRQAGWEVNSKELTFASGARPQRGTNRAIAEWPTSSGPADYVLFAGFTPLGILVSRNWTAPQRQWLQRIANQIKAETVVDREAFDHGVFAANGGFTRLNKTFEGQLETVVADLHGRIWQDAIAT